MKFMAEFKSTFDFFGYFVAENRRVPGGGFWVTLRRQCSNRPRYPLRIATAAADVF